MRSTLRRGFVVALGATAALSIGLGSALADPNLNHQGAPLADGFLPDSNDLVGTGSDTIQYVTTELAWNYDPASPSTRRLASFNAFKPGTEGAPVTGDQIVVRDPDQVPNSGDEVTIARPNGSSAGVNALLNPATAALLDFARSSRPSNGSSGEDTLSFIPFAKDGLSYVIDDISDVPTNLTAADLALIYTCELPGFAAKLPQAGSGTRAFFLSRIGVTEAQIAQAVAEGCVDDTVQEHDPSAVDGDALALAPFSSARHAVNPPDPTNPPSNVVTLASDVDPGAFSVSRDVFHVVKDAQVNDPDIQAVFGPNGYICTALADGEQGFTSVSDCGIARPDV